MKLIWKLLRQHISIGQFMGFLFANLVGLAIILVGAQFYCDIQAIYDGEDSFMRSDFLIINKQVSTLSGLTGKSSAFSEDEIEDLTSQPFVKSMGWFTSSDFSVKASFSIDNTTSFSTEMFFESVPDEFVDVKAADWTFQEGDSEIPIILPKNYLDLYNFGYAQTKSLPKLSEGILGAIKLNISLSGNGQKMEVVGNIVGFSSRLNTILVPQAFMEWANKEFGNGGAVDKLRLIMEVTNPADDAITSYLQDNGLETDESKLDASKTTYLLKIVVGVVLTVGLIICILSIYILMLSVFLLVEKNMTKLENLLLLGYSPAKVARPYQMLAVGLNIGVMILSVFILQYVRGIYLTMFEQFFPDMDIPDSWQAIAIGTTVLVVVSLFDILMIHNKVISIWKKR